MTDPYAYWKSALAGEKPKMFVDQPEAGFYRKFVKERDAKGNNKRVASKDLPVAVFIDDCDMVAVIGQRDVTGDELNELWSYIAGNPISEEIYRAVAERGEPWPNELAAVPAANREVTKEDNDAPEMMTDKDHAIGIDTAIGAALKKVTNETEAAQALGSKNRIAELRLAAEKAGKALYDPPFREYKRLHGLWSPMVARADTAEKALNKAILTFRETERVRIAAEQVHAEELQRRVDEANARAADRAIAAGEPEQPPEVVEILQPIAPAPILPTYGTRKIKEELKTFLDTVNDFDAIYTYFKDTAEVKTFLTTLATAAIKAGRVVPGVKTREGLI
jgi:hypothetical protein